MDQETNYENVHDYSQRFHRIPNVELLWVF